MLTRSNNYLTITKALRRDTNIKYRYVASEKRDASISTVLLCIYQKTMLKYFAINCQWCKPTLTRACIKQNRNINSISPYGLAVILVFGMINLRICMHYGYPNWQDL